MYSVLVQYNEIVYMTGTGTLLHGIRYTGTLWLTLVVTNERASRLRSLTATRVGEGARCHSRTLTRIAPRGASVTCAARTTTPPGTAITPGVAVASPLPSPSPMPGDVRSLASSWTLLLLHNPAKGASSGSAACWGPALC